MTNKSKEYFRKCNRCGYRKDNKEGLGFSWNVVIPQPIDINILNLDKDSIVKFTVTGKQSNIIRLQKA